MPRGFVTFSFHLILVLNRQVRRNWFKINYQADRSGIARRTGSLVHVSTPGMGTYAQSLWWRRLKQIPLFCSRLNLTASSFGTRHLREPTVFICLNQFVWWALCGTTCSSRQVWANGQALVSQKAHRKNTVKTGRRSEAPNCTEEKIGSSHRQASHLGSKYRLKACT